MKRAATVEEPMEDFGGAAVELLRGGAALARAENETLAQIAITRPRNPAKALASALKELELVPRFAAKQWYSIPFKNHDTGEVKNVEGLSIKAIMALARCWGNCSVSARVIEETPEAVLVDGVFVDFETMFRVSKPVQVSRFYRKKGTRQIVKWSEDRFPQILGIAASKAVRNAAENGIPEPIRQAYWERAREIAAEVAREVDGQQTGRQKKRDPRKLVEAILAKFAPWKVTRAILEEYHGSALEDLTEDQVTDLRGLLNALEQNQTTVAEAFGISGPWEEEPALVEADEESPLFKP